MKRITLFFVLLLTAQILVFAQKYPYPMEIEVKIAASFAEMRDNHFHMGLDMSTFNQENKPIHAVADGYVSRVSVSPYGYGRAVYINHPDGHTTVYGHMNAFCGEIDKAVRKAQYEKESFNVDLTFAPDEIPVKKWDVIALSGNTGGSQAPHLHFEVRDTETELALNPLAFLVDLPDNQVDENGFFKEWIDAEAKENHNHRHVSHLYGMYNIVDPEIAGNPALLEAVKKSY